MTAANLLFFGLALSYPLQGWSGEYERAADYTGRALLQTVYMQEQVAYIEHRSDYYLKEYLGTDRDSLVYFVWAAPLAYGKFTTKPFKNLAIKGTYWYVKPELEYRFTGETTTGLNLSWEF